MRVINVRNVHQALPAGLEHLHLCGLRSESRNGPVLVAPTPVMTVYTNPCERVLFWPERDANPFFHLFESFHMLAGSAEVDWLVEFNHNMLRYSDDGKTLHGAYGWRWRSHFDIDQIDEVVSLLSKVPTSRRAVLTMWDPAVDLFGKEEGAPKDLPCNTSIYLLLRGERLDMTVLCRSHDIIWGAYGANAVHFSILHEYLAALLKVQVGLLYQFSNNYHAYLDVFEKCRGLLLFAPDPLRTRAICPYQRGEVFSMPLVVDAAAFPEELGDWVYDGDYSGPWKNPIFEVATHLRAAFRYWKRTKDYESAITTLGKISNGSGGTVLDWKRACEEWLIRRLTRHQEKSQELP